ncbi:MAG: sigma-70 family RNA polymerase sigma factor [Planctomycetota bacterium]
MSTASFPSDSAGELTQANLESMRFYLWLLADRSLDDRLKRKVAPSDIVQLTYLEAHRDLEKFRGQTRADWRSWLRSILINNVRNAYRDCHAEKRAASRERPMEAAGDPVAAQRTPSSLAAFEEEFDLLERTLIELPREYQQAIEWRTFRRASFAEVGVQLGKSGEAARKVWFRAVQALQRQMSAAS